MKAVFTEAQLKQIIDTCTDKKAVAFAQELLDGKESDCVCVHRGVEPTCANTIAWIDEATQVKDWKLQELYSERDKLTSKIKEDRLNYIYGRTSTDIHQIPKLAEKQVEELKKVFLERSREWQKEYKCRIMGIPRYTQPFDISTEE